MIQWTREKKIFMSIILSTIELIKYITWLNFRAQLIEQNWIFNNNIHLKSNCKRAKKHPPENSLCIKWKQQHYEQIISQKSFYLNGFLTGMKSILSDLIIPLQLIPQHSFPLIMILRSISLLQSRGSFLSSGHSVTVISFRSGNCKALEQMLFNFLKFCSVKKLKPCKWALVLFHHLWRKFTQFANAEHFFNIQAISYLNTIQIWSKNKPCEVPQFETRAYISTVETIKVIYSFSRHFRFPCRVQKMKSSRYLKRAKMTLKLWCLEGLEIEYYSVI